MTNNKQQSNVTILGSLIRARRKEMALTQAQLAELADVSVRYVHDLERGKPTVRLAQLLNVIETLGLRLIVARGAGALVASHE